MATQLLPDHVTGLYSFLLSLQCSSHCFLCINHQSKLQCQNEDVVKVVKYNGVYQAVNSAVICIFPEKSRTPQESYSNIRIFPGLPALLFQLLWSFFFFFQTWIYKLINQHRNMHDFFSLSSEYTHLTQMSPL